MAIALSQRISNANDVDNLFFIGIQRLCRRPTGHLSMSAYSHILEFSGIEIPSAQGPESTRVGHST